MTFNSPLRKNYFFSKDTSIITQRREQSDSNSKSLSRSCDQINKKSPNNSFEKIRKDQFNKKQQNTSKLPPRPNIIHRSNNNNILKLRSHSINSLQTSRGLINSQNNINLNFKNQLNQKTKPQNQIDISTLRVLNIPKSSAKLQKYESQISQISTQVPQSLANNFILEDQRPGFVRFSEKLIQESQTNSKKSKSGRKGSLSILKNRKNAISCNKIDSNYLRFRDKTINYKEKVFDTAKMKQKQILQTLRQKFTQRMGNRPYSYLDLHQQQKYKDDLFPSNIHSLFYSKSKLEQIKGIIEQKGYEFVQITWKRVSDLFSANSKLVIFKQNSTQKMIKNQFSIASNDFILSLNAIKNVNQFFKKVFQPGYDKYQRHGIYCLKIFQQNSWKSIIIDDNIPIIVMKNNNNQQITYNPLFCDIQTPKNGQQIEVWPFLLQKAYASYYSSYEALHEGVKIIDLLQEFLMTPSQCYFFPDNQQLSEQVVKKLQNNIYQFPNSQSIIIGINMKTKQPCIIEKRSSQKTQQIVLKTLKSERKMKIKHVFEIINTFYLFLPFHFKYFNASSVNFNKIKKPLKQHPMTKIKNRQQILFRTFNTDSQGPFSLSIRQKERRFYQRNLKKYDYLWNRVIIIQKQFGQSYRWIDGKYSNQKSINFNLYLQKGQYSILIMPELGPQEILYDLTMIVYSNIQIGIQKKVYQQKQRILETACCDIAQRKGVFKQLNDYTCSYSYIEKSSALIIQNVNNQKSNGQVALTRSIGGLKAKVEIVPFNMEFCINENEPNIHKRKYKKVVQILIEKQSHFTVVLMMRGGIDQKFFKVFKFGN